MESFDHIVVGGGIIGASIAYHLRRGDAGSVLLLERNELAGAASSQAAGLVLQASTKPSTTPMAKLTTETVQTLEAELGESIGYHAVGSLRIATSDDSAAQLDAMADDASKWDIPVEWPGVSEVSDMVRWLDTGKIRKVAFLPGDGYVDPYLFSMSYIRAAQALGAVVRPRTNVHEVQLAGQNVAGVLSDAGPVAGGTVIDACGVQASLLSERVGYALPMAPVRSHYWIAESDEAYGGEHPATIFQDIAAYTRPELGGLVVGVQEARSATFDARHLPHDMAAFSPTQGEEHWDVLAGSYEALAQFFPAISSARFSAYVCGLSSYTPDGEIILGPVPGVSGFYVAAGDCGSGITLSAGMGAMIADLVLGRRQALDIAPFRPDRFGTVDPHCLSFRESCAAARATKLRKGSGRL